MKPVFRHRYPRTIHLPGGRGWDGFGKTNTGQAFARIEKGRRGRTPLGRGAWGAIPLLSTLLLLMLPAQASPWVRSFVVTAYEPAFHYDSAGGDCPRGTVPDNDYARLLQTPWRSAADIAALMKPDVPSIEPYLRLAPALHQRGFAAGIDTYINPFAAPDPGLPEVTGRIADGFNLDGKTATGFGVQGIDNGFYRALGCLAAFRGPPGQGTLNARANTRMQEGLQTILIRLSGNASPDRDDAVTVEIGPSPDHLERNLAGVPLRDYSYRLVASTAYTKLSGRIRDGVLTTAPVADLKAPDFAWSESNRGEAHFLRGRLQLKLTADGATGLIGGYRDWRALYARLAFNVAVEGPFLEIPFHENLIAIYYALARNADAIPDAKGRNSAISTAYRLTALPAFAVDQPAPLAWVQPPPSQRILQERAAFARAAAGPSIMPSP